MSLQSSVRKHQIKSESIMLCCCVQVVDQLSAINAESAAADVNVTLSVHNPTTRRVALTDKLVW